MRRSIPSRAILGAAVALLCGLASRNCAAQEPSPVDRITVHWDKPVIVSRSTPAFQVVVNPMLRAGSPIHDSAFASIKALGADYVRYVPWLPYPKLAVAELEPPTPGKTSWDFSLIDPMMLDFFHATEGHSTIVNFSTIPAWLFATPKPIPYPADANQVDWNYTQGTELKDPTGQQLGAYYARLVSWYTRGGFTDENGKTHSSGYHFPIPYWEVLNEVESEHSTTPEQYTERYDAIVSAIHDVSPQTKFVALALADPSANPRYFEYFLDHAHHKPGIPLDFISYHFYATPTREQTAEDWQYSFFDQADRFLATVRYIEAIRRRLSPETKTDTDELGVILPTDNTPHDAKIAIPNIYWNAAGALYAYLYLSLAQQGIEAIGESQLVGYPSQYPSVTMIDWKNGKPNARYWVLKLIVDNFHSGDTLMTTDANNSDVAAQAFSTASGRKLLLVNKRNRSLRIALPQGLTVRELSTVDAATGEGPARSSQPTSSTLDLAPFAVAVANLQ
ncbi:MAG TPA: glycosyl hydrolase family 39 [Acidobacteriaceae bacterium]